MEPNFKECPECEGTGRTYYSCCGDDMRGEDIDLCPTCHEHQGDEGGECEECGGTGEVPDMAKLKGLYDAEVRAGIYDSKNPTETLTQKMEKAFNFKRHGIEYDHQ